jgi:hypothetical protein
MTSPSALRCILFPHTVMSQTEYRYLSLLVPQVSLLQSLGPPNIPDWGQEHFLAHPGVEDEELRKRVQLYLKGYHDFADRHRGGDMLAALRHEFSADNGETSRFLLQSELRGKPPQAPNPMEWLLLEAAVFLELARDLDLKEIDLETGFQQLEELQEAFRQILGSTEDEEFEAVIDASDSALVPDQNRLSFLLSKRQVSWYRLAAAGRFAPPFVTISISKDVVEELIDPIQSEWESTDGEFSLVRIPLTTLPSIHQLQPQQFVELLGGLKNAGILLRYWDALAEVVNGPHEKARREQLDHEVQVLRDHVDSFLIEKTARTKQQMTLVLTHLEGIGHNEYWKGLDKAGYEQFQTGQSELSLQPVLLHLEWKS